MSGKHQAVALQLLQIHSDGLTLRELQYVMAVRLKVADRALRSVPHRYVDRWKLEQGDLVEVYCLAEIPPDAPHPHLCDGHVGQ